MLSEKCVFVPKARIDRGERIVFAQVVAAEPDKTFKFPGLGFNPTCWRAVYKKKPK